MDGKMGAAASQMTSTFEPTFDLIQEEECDTLLIYLPGFTKEQLRVQLAKSGTLKISGTRPIIGDNKWSNFQKDFPVPSNCDTTKITAKFEGGILYIRLPKLIVPAHKSEEEEEEKKIPPPSETPPPPPPPAGEQATTQKTDDHNNHNTVDSLTSKKEEKSTVDESGKDEKDEKVNKESNNRDFVTKLGDDYKQNAVSPMEKLKMGRKMMNMVMVVLFAFVLGMYSTKLVSIFKRGD